MRCPRISFFAHLAGLGRSEVSALFIFSNIGLAWATVRPRSVAAAVNGLLNSELLPALIHPRPGLIVHQNLIRPRTGKALRRPLARGIDSHLGAVVGKARGMIERIDRPQRELDVALGIDVIE